MSIHFYLSSLLYTPITRYYNLPATWIYFFTPLLTFLCLSSSKSFKLCKYRYLLCLYLLLWMNLTEDWSNFNCCHLHQSVMFITLSRNTDYLLFLVNNKYVNKIHWQQPLKQFSYVFWQMFPDWLAWTIIQLNLCLTVDLIQN